MLIFIFCLSIYYILVFWFACCRVMHTFELRLTLPCPQASLFYAFRATWSERVSSPFFLDTSPKFEFHKGRKGLRPMGSNADRLRRRGKLCFLFSQWRSRRNLLLCLFINVAYICTWIGEKVKEVLWSIITWSILGKQNIQAKEVYCLEKTNRELN